MNSRVYVVTNTVTHKQYVGLTNGTIEDRWKRHLNCSHTNGRWLLHRSIRKYGVSSFIIELVEECDSVLVKDAEKRWIAKLNTFMPNGYNMTLGGDGVLGRIVSDEEKLQRSLAAKLRFADPMQRENQKRCQLFKTRPVDQLTIAGDLIATFPSIIEAERQTGASHVKECCRGKRKSAMGCLWRYSIVSPLPTPRR